MDNAAPWITYAAAGVIGYLLYDKYIYRQQSPAINQLLLGGATGGTGPTGTPSPNATAPRGIRNNNPGNIKWSAANNWVGQSGKDSAGFAVFNSAQNGLRAAAHLVRTYVNSYHLDTLGKISPRWSPDAIGISGAYAAGAAKLAGMTAATVIDPNNAAQMVNVLRGIVGQENGAAWINTYPASVYQAAVAA